MGDGTDMMCSGRAIDDRLAASICVIGVLATLGRGETGTSDFSLTRLLELALALNMSKPEKAELASRCAGMMEGRKRDSSVEWVLIICQSAMRCQSCRKRAERGCHPLQP